MTEPGPRFHAFADATLATGVLCARLVKVLQDAITPGAARRALPVSGGSTPRALYQQLAREKLDWERKSPSCSPTSVGWSRAKTDRMRASSDPPC